MAQIISKSESKHYSSGCALGTSFRKINRPLQAKYKVNAPLDCHTEFTQHFRAHAEISVLSAKNQDPNSKRKKKKRNNKLAEKREHLVRTQAAGRPLFFYG